MSRSSARKSLDRTIYPEEERVGESMQQRRIAELVRPLLEWWLRVIRKTRAFVGADQFIYYRQYDAHARVSPDVYVVPGADPDAIPKSWKLWIRRVPPSFALEIVSDEWEKDYIEAPPRYDAAGVAELVIFDPQFESRELGVRWQVFRRVGKRGLVRVEVTNADRVKSRTLGCWLRVIGEAESLRVRIAEGPRGDSLVPTAEEREQAERAAKEAEQAAKEAERAAKEAERAAKETALARVAELEARLRRLESRRSRRASK